MCRMSSKTGASINYNACYYYLCCYIVYTYTANGYFMLSYSQAHSNDQALSGAASPICILWNLSNMGTPKFMWYLVPYLYPVFVGTFSITLYIISVLFTT